jgi:hypothetical protein
VSALVLVSASAASASTWVRRGVVACHVAEQHGWTLVSAAPGRVAAAAPYDDPTSVLLARPVGPRVAPSLGLGVVGDRAVIAAQSTGWRTMKRWAVRMRRGSLVRQGDLAPLRPGDLAPFAGAGVSTAEVTAALEETQLPSHDWLAHVLEVLQLPGAQVVRGEDQPGALVEPDPRSLAGFARVAEDGRP